MTFLTEPSPRRGVAHPVVPGISRIIANNPGPMTYHGTNTYLIGAADGFVVLDPGPDDEEHIGAILATTGGRVSAILLSHSHSDHLGATAALKARTGAKTFAYHLPAHEDFTPDVLVEEGDVVDGMTAVHTPGHASDHLCYCRPDGILFSGDHVMSWSSSVVSPPGGDMAAYFASLRRMLARNDVLYLPGHGPPLPNPTSYVEGLLTHRLRREQTIFESLSAEPLAPSELVDRLYSKTHPRLWRAAERNVVAHLLKLEAEGRVQRDGERWRSRTAG